MASSADHHDGEWGAAGSLISTLHFLSRVLFISSRHLPRQRKNEYNGTMNNNIITIMYYQMDSGEL
jgi:hypothetical protein